MFWIQYMVDAINVHRIGTARFFGRKNDQPSALVIRNATLRFPVEFNRHPLARRAESPDTDRYIPLQHHSVPNEAGNPHLAAGIPSHK